MHLIIMRLRRLILLGITSLAILWTNQIVMSSRFPAASWLAVLLLLPFLGTAQVQEWAYHELDHLDHSHVLTWPDWGTDRIIAAGNDLEDAATRLVPAIGTVLVAIRDCEGLIAAQMSGSGTACFGLFKDAGVAATAAQRLADSGLWAVATGF